MCVDCFSNFSAVLEYLMEVYKSHISCLFYLTQMTEINVIFPQTTMKGDSRSANIFPTVFYSEECLMKLIKRKFSTNFISYK